MASHVTETPITPLPSSATALPSAPVEWSVPDEDHGRRILQLEEENAQFGFAIRNLEAAVFGQQLQPSAKKQKH